MPLFSKFITFIAGTLLALYIYKFKKPFLTNLINHRVQDNINDKIKEVQQQLKDKTNLLDHISHEIRSPLHGVSSIAQFLYEKWESIDEQDRKKYIGIIAQNSNRLVNLTNELLDFSKFSAGKIVFHFAPINLLDTIKNNVREFQELNVLAKDIKFIFIDNDFQEAIIYGDQTRINQLLSNLFSNAVKYTKQGMIVAMLDSINIDGKNYWQFSLMDTGIGIPDNELESIFVAYNRSSRTEEKFIGTGIGLAICREIVEAHHGHIQAENNSQQGAKLRFTIPCFNKNTLREIENASP